MEKPPSKENGQLKYPKFRGKRVLQKDRTEVYERLVSIGLYQ